MMTSNFWKRLPSSSHFTAGEFSSQPKQIYFHFKMKWKAPPEVYIRHKLHLSVALENRKSFWCSGWIGWGPLSLTHLAFPSFLRQPLRLLRGIPGARSILWQSMDGNLDSTRLSLIVFNIWCPFEEAYQFVSWRVLNWAGLVTMSRRRQWHPAPVLFPGKSHGRRSLMDCSPWGRYELDTTERLHFHFSLSCIGEGNGNPLQYSCLENPRDGGAWWAAVYGVTQSQTRLKWLSSSSSSSSSNHVQRNGVSLQYSQ